MKYNLKNVSLNLNIIILATLATSVDTGRHGKHENGGWAVTG